MRRIITTTLSVALLGSALSAQTLNVYTYDSFASEWGPGPALEALYEETCDCDLVFTTAGDGAALLTRLRLEGASSQADVIMGIDQNLAELAEESDLLAPHHQAPQVIHGADVTLDNPLLRAFDWGHFAFVYKASALENPPKSFEELAQSALKIVIQDPRSSTPGLGLVTWVYQLFGEETAQYWSQLSDNIVTVTPGWSESYALFLEGNADMVLSYTTSPAYHFIAEGDTDFRAAKFDDGHALQIELMGILKTAQNPTKAADFLAFVETPEAQAIINGNNWMYPVVDIDLPDGFADPKDFETLETDNGKAAIDAAKAAFGEGIS